jgi:peptidoglycan/LPS O-acetylase OafA/YrhL
MVSDSSENTPGSRNAYLDHIRVFLTVMVVMAHSAITYGSIGGWYTFEVKTTDLSLPVQAIYVAFNAVNQSYFMGMFFLMAGYFTPFSLLRKGFGRFANDRLVRLGIPLLLFVVLLHPFTAGMGEEMKGTYPFWGVVQWFYTGPHIGTGPLWFALALLVFTFVYLACRFIRPTRIAPDDAPLPGHGTLFAAAVGTGLFAFLLRLLFPVGTNIIDLQLGYFASYILLFYTGTVAARHRWLERVEARHAVPWMVVTLVATPLFLLAFGSCSSPDLIVGGVNQYAFFYAMWEPFEAWGIILGLLWLTRRYLNRTSPFWRELALSSFPAYFIHAPVLVGLSLACHGWAAPALVKWIVVGGVATVLSFALGSVLRRLPGLRRVF